MFTEHFHQEKYDYIIWSYDYFNDIVYSVVCSHVVNTMLYIAYTTVKLSVIMLLWVVKETKNRGDKTTVYQKVALCWLQNEFTNVADHVLKKKFGLIQ